MQNRRTFMARALLACSLTLAGAAPALAADNVVRIATDATFPPMEFVENGKMTGFDIDLTNALAKQMGKAVQWTQIDFKGLIPGVLSGRFDMAVSAIYITPERAKVVDFGDSYYAGGLVVMVKKDNNTIKSIDDLAGKNVTVQVGTKSVEFLKTRYPKVHAVEVEQNEQTFSLVEIGRADAAVTGMPAAYQFARTKGTLKVLPKQLTTEAYGMAVSKNEPQLTAALNKALAALKADGTYDKIVHKWFANDK